MVHLLKDVDFDDIGELIDCGEAIAVLTLGAIAVLALGAIAFMVQVPGSC